jgi:hypothetical protein
MMKKLRFDRRFRFGDQKLNNRLIRLVLKAGISFAVDQDYYVYYRSEDEERFEDVLAVIRSAVFPAWQVLSFPKIWTSRYRSEMERRGVEYQEEWTNGSVEFLISQEHKPHAWKLD